jgi:hypothetical protein
MDLQSQTFVNHGVVDTQALAIEIRKIEDSPLWDDPHRKQIFEQQSATENLPFVWAPIVARKTFSTFVNTRLLETPVGIEYTKITQQVLKLVPGKILHGGIIRMFPNTEIPMHYDGIHELWHCCHRLHLPVITEPGVRFTYGTVSRHLETNTLTEINNFLLHGVIHAGHNMRYHVMYDILPESYTGSYPVEYHEDPERFKQDRQLEIQARAAKLWWKPEDL